MFILSLIAALVFLLFSYSFIDANLLLATGTAYTLLETTLTQAMKSHRLESALLYIGFIILFYSLYVWSLKRKKSWCSRRQCIILLIILTLSFPAFTYDIFNYILTAKVAYLYHENPYIVMPIEIAHEPMLAFTRAANKFALYGPTWILSTFVPYIIGGGKVWVTIISFKLFVGVLYGCACWILVKLSHDKKSALLFAANPLVLVEIFVNGHNDIAMMLLVLVAYFLSRKIAGLKGLIAALLFLFLSIFVKGASLVLIPVYFFFRNDEQKLYVWSFLAMFFVFLLTPLREELYPWYAVWFLVFVPLLSKKYMYLRNAAVVLSFGLLLRHAPYIGMGYYEGPGPMLRLVCTLLPISIFTAIYILNKKIRNHLL